MKSILSLSAITAVLLFSGCAKDTADYTAPRSTTCELSFGSEKPEIMAISRTERVDDHVVWNTSGEAIRIAHSSDGYIGFTFYTSTGVAVSDDRKNATFTAKTSFRSGAISPHVFYAGYPAAAFNGDDDDLPSETIPVAIKSAQRPSATSFDCAADILVGKSDEYPLVPVDGTPIPMRYNRIVSLGHVTLSGLALADDETISNITFTTPERKLSGNIKLNLMDQTFDSSHADNFVSLLYDKATPAKEGTFEAWFCSLPFTLTEGDQMSVKVTTSLGVYTKDITVPEGRSIKFLKNRCCTLEIDMEGIERKTLTTNVTITCTGTNLANYDVIYSYWLESPTSTGTTRIAVTATSDGHLSFESAGKGVLARISIKTGFNSYKEIAIGRAAGDDISFSLDYNFNPVWRTDIYGNRLVSIAQELIAMRSGTNLSGSSNKYLQTGNIDLRGQDSWSPIGTSQNYAFKGSYNGDGYTIDNMTISASADYKGLFGYATNTIRNVTIGEGSSVTGNNYVGAVCGYYISADAKIENCKNYGKIASTSTSDNHLGGICGYYHGNATAGCENHGTVTGKGPYVGGIFGFHNGGSISDCENHGAVTGDGSYVGGVCGIGVGVSIKNCKNSAAITSNYNSATNYLGGICGYSKSGSSIADCSNSGKITGGGIIGGICGKTEADDIIDNCTNSGTIARASTASSSLKNFGGICGYNSGRIKNCTNTQSLTITNSNVGGICGYNDNGSISACNNSNAINGGSYTGGVCGYSGGENPKIENCTNSGKIGTSSYTGGICGYNTGAIMSCENSNEIEGTSRVGGICGRSEGLNAKIDNCTNTKSVSASDYAGGICGDCYSPITNCKVSANVTATGHIGGICGATTSSVADCKVTSPRDIYVYGKDYFGGVCGEAKETAVIEHCYCSSAVLCEYRVVKETWFSGKYLGGICGYNSGRILQCEYRGPYITTVCEYGFNPYGGVAVTFIEYSGGICGYNNEGTISDCLSVTRIASNSIDIDLSRYKSHADETYKGGICGCNYYGEISNCYSDCTGYPAAHITYLHGPSALVTNCYYNPYEWINNTKVLSGDADAISNSSCFGLSESNWPSAAKGWKLHGEGGAWASLGGWNSGGETIVYPTLWWE